MCVCVFCVFVFKSDTGDTFLVMCVCVCVCVSVCSCLCVCAFVCHPNTTSKHPINSQNHTNILSHTQRQTHAYAHTQGPETAISTLEERDVLELSAHTPANTHTHTHTCIYTHKHTHTHTHTHAQVPVSASGTLV